MERSPLRRLRTRALAVPFVLFAGFYGSQCSPANGHPKSGSGGTESQLPVGPGGFLPATRFPRVPGPSATVPLVTLPTVTLPPVTLPPVTLPPVTLPPVTLPPVTLPPITLPPATTPPTTTPPTTAPPTTVPATTVPATTAPATTTPATTAPNGVPGGPAPVVRKSSACTFPTQVSVAFCDSFDAPASNPNSRSGDLDASIWGVSRTNTWTNVSQGQLNTWYPTRVDGCGPTTSAMPTSDVRICNGKVYEAVTDGTGQSTLALYPKQPFDIAGNRPGVVVFDVSADSEGPHAAWPEFWWTDQPVPAPHGHLAAQAPYGKNSFGFGIDAQCPQDGPYTSGDHQPYVGIGEMMLTVESKAVAMPWTRTGCVLKGNANALNHFEVRFNTNGHTVEVWGSDPGGANLRMLGWSSTAMSLTRGVIWLEDVHYNANKFDTQGTHTFVWDNVGFDGPTPYRDLTFDVRDNNQLHDGGVNLGYQLAGSATTTLSVDGVHWLQQPTKSFVTLNWFPYEKAVPSVRVNGGTWQDMAWPFDDETYAWRTIAIPIPMDQVRPGANTIEFRYSGSTTIISNINLTLIAASAVP